MATSPVSEYKTSMIPETQISCQENDKIGSNARGIIRAVQGLPIRIQCCKYLPLSDPVPHIPTLRAFSYWP